MAEIKERNVIEVIERIIKEVPEEETDLIERLEWIKTDAEKRPSKDHLNCWLHLSSYLGENLNCPANLPWEIKVKKIIKG